MTNKKVKHLNVEKRIDNLYQVWYFLFGNVIINDKGGRCVEKDERAATDDSKRKPVPPNVEE